MLPESTEDRERFVPEGQKTKPAETARAYWLAPLSVRERKFLKCEQMDRGGANITTARMRKTIREGIEAVWTGETADKARAVLEEVIVHADAPAADGVADQQAQAFELAKLVNELNEVAADLSHEYAPLRKLLRAQEERFQELLILRVQLGVRDWENVKNRKGEPVPCTRNVAHGLTEAALNAIPADDFDEIAIRVRELAEVSEDEQKN